MLHLHLLSPDGGPVRKKLTGMCCTGDLLKQPAGGGQPQLTGRAAGYAQAVCELNQAVAERKPFNAVAAFAAACTDEQQRETA